MGHVFLTIDTEYAWRHHAAGCDGPAIHARSIEPAGVGISWQLKRLAAHRLKACFFVDPMPAAVFGIEPFRRLVGDILDAGQEVQLHCHPNWVGAEPGDRGQAHAHYELVDYDGAGQRELITRAAALLADCGAPAPIAFRAGSYGADDATLDALAASGIFYDSSHNGAVAPWPSGIALPRAQIAPVTYRGVIEVPITTIEEAPGRLRNAQICALSAGEMSALLDHAVAERHVATTIVTHAFELANRDGTGANAVHVARFEALLADLAERRDVLPTTHFRDRTLLALDAVDRPLGPSLWRLGYRHVEQAWSNWVAERAA